MLIKFIYNKRNLKSMLEQIFNPCIVMKIGNCYYNITLGQLTKAIEFCVIKHADYLDNYGYIVPEWSENQIIIYELNVIYEKDFFKLLQIIEGEK